MVEITIYLLCYNEEIMLPHTLDHYTRRFPRAKFVLIDNESTDSSVAIAQARGCEIYTWQTKNEANIVMNIDLKNSIWKTATTDWVIVADMDEWLDITEAQLAKEDAMGSTMLHCRGTQIVAESQSLTLDDIDLHTIKTGFFDKSFDKHVCFKRSEITEINYTRGAHKTSEKGRVKYSNNVYIFKHLNFLGLPWFQAKMKARFARTHYNRSLRASGHYYNDDKSILDKFEAVRKATKVLF
jgi:glycosyltransferase involved in cell wall biosynthesis